MSKITRVRRLPDGEQLKRIQGAGFVATGEVTLETVFMSTEELGELLGVDLVGVGELGDLGFFHKKVWRGIKKVTKFVSRPFRAVGTKAKRLARKINWKKVLKIGLPIAAIAAVAIFAPFALMPMAKLGKVVGLKAAGLIKGGATFAQVVVTGAGKKTLALLTLKQQRRLKKAGMNALVAITTKRLARFGVGQNQVMDEWEVVGNRVDFTPGDFPTEVELDDGKGFNFGGMTPVLVIGGGALLLFAIGKMGGGQKK